MQRTVPSDSQWASLPQQVAQNRKALEDMAARLGEVLTEMRQRRSRSSQLLDDARRRRVSLNELRAGLVDARRGWRTRRSTPGSDPTAPWPPPGRGGHRTRAAPRRPDPA